ncbi:hypothetical protein EMIHUDRAFT_120966, partial [Emiliania huxleyi CCMP1516]
HNLGGKDVSLGCFGSAVEAAVAYARAVGEEGSAPPPRPAKRPRESAAAPAPEPTAPSSAPAAAAAAAASFAPPAPSLPPSRLFELLPDGRTVHKEAPPDNGGMAAVADALGRIGLQSYVAAFDSEGFDDIDFLLGLDRAERAAVATATGMDAKPGHAGKWVRRRSSSHAAAQLPYPATNKPGSVGGPPVLRTTASAPQQKPASASTPFMHEVKNWSKAALLDPPAEGAARRTSQRLRGTPVGAVEKTAARSGELERAAAETAMSTSIETTRSIAAAPPPPPRSRIALRCCSSRSSSAVGLYVIMPARRASVGTVRRVTKSRLDDSGTVTVSSAGE